MIFDYSPRLRCVPPSLQLFRRVIFSELNEDAPFLVSFLIELYMMYFDVVAVCLPDLNVVKSTIRIGLELFRLNGPSIVAHLATHLGRVHATRHDDCVQERLETKSFRIILIREKRHDENYIEYEWFSERLSDANSFQSSHYASSFE